jgi:hypothetical protein
VPFGVVICEDKATTQPRRVITNDVWPEVRMLESGARDAEILSEVTTVLLAALGQADTEAALKDINWSSVRRYRVSVTASSIRRRVERRRALFKGFRTVAPGRCERRRGEMLIIDDLRPWMTQFARDVAREIRKLKAQRV